MSNEVLQARIRELKKDKNALIIAHNYQPREIQDIADFCGDSFELCLKASESDAEVLIFCGVHFMAETANLLCPEKKVILPELSAGCTMADMVEEQGLLKMKERHPGAAAVCYINSPAAVKARCKVCCTSANALKVIESLEEDEIIFVPDKNLANYIARRTEKKIIPWEGYCQAHDSVTPEDVARAREAHPEALLIVHPESRAEVIELADFAGGTGDMLKFVGESDAREFIVGTEMGMLYPLEKRYPEKVFHPLSEKMFCPDMKKISLEAVLKALENSEPEVIVPKEIAEKALQAVQRMMEIR